MGKYIIGVDVGGTFTDCVVLNRETGEIRSTKARTTPEDQSLGVMESLSLLGISGEDIAMFFHGFTVGINAVLTRTGAKTGLLATAGHHDLLDMGRNWRGTGEWVMDPTWVRGHQLRPLVERRYRRPIFERLGYDGSTVEPLDEAQVRQEVEFLKKEGIESIAICFLNSFVDGRHEERARQIVKEVFPEARVQTSAINPVTKEYERTCTVVVDAYIGPVTQRYLTRLADRLRGADYSGDILIMQLSGGARVLESAAAQAVYSLYSGPVAGALGSASYANQLGVPNVISLDVGGTSTDTCVIRNGEPVLTSEVNVEEDIITLILPSVNVRSIGSGGGSLIYLDGVGRLRVGPESAGARPGPACYSLGGTRATQTDAYVVMGLLHPRYFMGGRLPLDAKEAEKVLVPIAQRLGLSLPEIAEAAFEVSNVQMAQAVREISCYRGFDTREFSLLAFGSAGPMHACYVARELSMPEVIVPIHPGAFCAFGLISSDVRVDYSAAPMKFLDTFSPEEFDDAFRQLEIKVIDDLKKEGFSPEKVKLQRVYYGMYFGQTWDNRTPISGGPYDANSMGRIKEEFHQRYLDAYGYSAPELPIVVTTLTATGVVGLPVAKLRKLERGTKQPRAEAILTTGDIYLEKQMHKGVRYYDRSKLLAGNVIEGPAIIAEDFATTVLDVGSVLKVDELGSLRITP